MTSDVTTYAQLRITAAGFQAITDVIREASESNAPPEIMEQLIAMHHGLRMKLELVRAEFDEEEGVVEIDANALKGKSEEQIRTAILNAMPAGMKQ